MTLVRALLYAAPFLTLRPLLFTPDMLSGPTAWLSTSTVVILTLLLTEGERLLAGPGQASSRTRRLFGLLAWPSLRTAMLVASSTLDRLREPLAARPNRPTVSVTLEKGPPRPILCVA